MNRLQMRRRPVMTGAVAICVVAIGLAVLSALGVLRSPTTVSAKEQATSVRWDLINLSPPDVLAGGQDSAHAQDGSQITLTGSGTFNPEGSGDVTGGGTWTATGSVTGSGTYEVTGLVSFIPAPGVFPPLTDDIGNPADASAGLVVLRIAYSDGSTGVLTVSCALPGAPPAVFEGITVTMGAVDFWNHDTPTVGVHSNRTVFHILRAN